MTAYPTWTPAPRPGIIPLHPLSFGVILGRSFTALRQNPKVLLGFALVVQTVGLLLATAGIVAVGFASFGRLASLEPGTDEFTTVLAGSIAISGVTALVLSLASGALSVIVQGIVVSEVAHAVVAEKQTLGQLWRRVKPVAWRLIGYTVLVALIVLVVVGLLVGGFVLLSFAIQAWTILIGVLVGLAAIPLSLWLSTKLLLVPSALVLEQATITGAIARSWRLTRGRFWPTLGVVVIISITFGVLGQVVSVPFSFLTSGLTTIFAPTDELTSATIVTTLIGSLLTQAVVLLIQTIATIVQSTAGALVYIDCRMRREGLDLDLSSYVDRRDSGAHDLPDPYRQNVGRDLVRSAPAAAYGPAVYGPGSYGPQGYAPQGGYPGGHPAHQGGYPGQPGAYDATQDAGSPAPQPDAPHSGIAQPAPPAPPAPTSSTDWTAPGSDRA